jgi:hypothetical protein
MLWIRLLLAFGLFAPLWSPPYPLFAQTLVPIQAELVQRLNAGKARVGDPILAKLVLPWKGSTCDLRAGAILEGRVVTQRAYSKTEKTSEIGILFESGQCGGARYEAAVPDRSSRGCSAPYRPLRCCRCGRVSTVNFGGGPEPEWGSAESQPGG